MSVLLRRNRFRPWQLTGPQGFTPTVPSNGQVQFTFRDVPPITQGRFANYMPCLALTAFGTIAAATGGSGRMTWEDVAVALYKNFDMVGAWHGKPINNQSLRGVTARIWELLSMGYQSGARHSQWFSSSTATAFRHTLYVPLSVLTGDDPDYAAQLSILFENAQFMINTAGVGTVLPNGNQVTALTANVRCSAILVPQPVLRLAPGNEWQEYIQQGATANSNIVQVQSMGDQTSLDGVQSGAGLNVVLALCGVEQIDGAFTADQLTQLSVPFLDITETQHLDPFMQMLEQVVGTGQRPRSQYVTDAVVGPPGLLGQVTDFSGFPYTDGSPGNASGGLSAGALCVPFLVPGQRMQVTKLPVISGTVNYYRTITAAAGATDRTLVNQYKSWQPNKVADWLQLVISKGLADAVYGTRDLVPNVALNDAAATVDPLIARFLPVEYVPRPPAAVAK